jgi:hypothetical protein
MVGAAEGPFYGRRRSGNEKRNYRIGEHSLGHC